MHAYYAVDATVEVVVSKVQSSFDLCVSYFTGGLHEEIRLFDGIVGSHVLRHVIAVTVYGYGCLDMKVKVGPVSCEEEHCRSFKVMDDGYASQQIKTQVRLNLCEGDLAGC